MPAPSAAWIMSMLNPYAGHRPDSGNALGFANLGQQRAQLGQRQKEFDVDSQRQQGHLDLQNRMFDTSQQNEARDRQMKAFTAFQAAVDSGDTEQAALAAQALRLTGVDVEEYGAGEGGSGAPRMPTSLDSMAKESPSAAVAQAQAQRAATPKQKQMAELDAMGKEAEATTRGAAPEPSQQQIQETLKYYAENPPQDEEEAAFREDWIRSVAGGESMEEASAKARAMKTPTAWSEQIDYDPKTGRGSGKYWRAVGGDAEGNPIEEELMPTDDVGARPMRTTGVPETPEQPATSGAEQQMSSGRGYRLNFGGKVIDISPDSVLERQRSRVQGALMPILNSANTPEEKAAAQAAMDVATKAVGIYSPDKAMLIGIDHYQAEMDRDAKTKRARIVGGKGGDAAGEGFGGIPGMTKEGNQLLSGRFDDEEAYIRGYETRFNVVATRGAIQQGQKVMTLLSGDNPVAQRAALTATLKQWFSSVTSNMELGYLQQSGGIANQLQMEFNKYADEGRLPEDFIRRLKEGAVQIDNELRRHLIQVGEQAVNELDSRPSLTQRMTPDEQEAFKRGVFGRLSGRSVKRKKGTAGTGGTGAPKGKPKEGANDRARRLLGK